MGSAEFPFTAAALVLSAGIAGNSRYSMARIYLSYRRADSAQDASRICAVLTERFGADSVWMDMQFARSTDFTRELRKIIASCDVVLAIVGPDWRGVRHGQKNALDNRADAIRLELQAALDLETPLIPILVRHASMPSPDDVPASLRKFCQRNALHVESGPDFSRQVNELMKTMDSIVAMRAHLRTQDPTTERVASAKEPSGADLRAVAARQQVTAHTKIVISYRRSDSPGAAGRLYDRLEDRFGAGSVFIDVDSIPFGMDFRRHIENALANCRVLIALIGRNWVGRRFWYKPRIFDANDPIRLEISTALRHRVPIIPVLLKGAVMPTDENLPAELQGFSALNAPDLDPGRDFRQHTERIIEAIEPHFER